MSACDPRWESQLSTRADQVLSSVYRLVYFVFKTFEKSDMFISRF